MAIKLFLKKLHSAAGGVKRWLRLSSKFTRTKKQVKCDI